MTDRSKLLALAEAVEKLTGPDRDIDREIGKAVNARIVPVMGAWGVQRDYRVYTSSIDAAMMLVPVNSLWNVGTDIDGPYARVLPPVGNGWLGSKEHYVLAATMPLALCAAALRAQAEALS